MFLRINLNMKRLIVTALFIAMIGTTLCGCSKNETSNNKVIVEPVIKDDVNDTSSSGQIVDSNTPPKEGMVRSRITNEWVDEKINNTRPIAIMIPNTSTASFCGLSKASVLYECNVEGSMTRLMGVFDDWTDADKLGNIRSSRDYYIYWAFEWDAIYIHYGGPFYIDDVVSRDDTQNINCIYNEEYTFRDEAKNSTDNAFTSAEKIKKAMNSFGYPLEYRPDYADDQHYLFAEYEAPNTLTQYEDAIDASKIDMAPCFPVTNCYFIYNEDTGNYDRYQKLSGSADGPHIDELNNEQLSFKNIIIQNTYHEVRDQKGYLAFQVHDDTRDGWFFTNGKGIHINWKKVSDYGATRYYDDNGEEIKLNTGKTMVLILEDGDSFSVNDKLIRPIK